MISNIRTWFDEENKMKECLYIEEIIDAVKTNVVTQITYLTHYQIMKQQSKFQVPSSNIQEPTFTSSINIRTQMYK